MTKRYLIADLFCGAGGSSTGAQRTIEELGGTMELVAVNHWPKAIATHSANHPDATHVIEDVDLVDPEAVVPDGKLDLLMASPECKFHSKARGGKPIHDQGRMQPWAIFNWLTKLDVANVLVENVPEFVDWGPVDPVTKKPIDYLKGTFFEPWYLAFLNLGYSAEWRMLNAADFGDATSRTRFFLIARQGGRPILWPEPSHAEGDTGMFPGRKRWRGAREIIDWSDRGKSLLDDPKYRKKPLAVNTRKRIAKGFGRNGGVLAPFYIRLLDIPGREDIPVDDMGGAPTPFILNRNGENGHHRCKPVDAPMATATGRGAGYLVNAEVVPFLFANRNNAAPKTVDEPVPVITTAHGGGSCLVSMEALPFVLGQQSGAAPRDTGQPLPTIAAAGAISLVSPFITEYHGESTSRSVELPVSTITAEGNHHGLVMPFLTQYYRHGDWSPVDAPVPTVTTKARHALAMPTLVEVAHSDNDHERRFCSLDHTLPTIATRRTLGVAMPGLVEHSVEPEDEELERPIDPRRLVMVDGSLYVLDIRFRMLRNDELARATGFDEDESRYVFHGNVGEVTRQIGNAVPVNVAAALVKAILSEGASG